jgi:hypothetical protein
LIDARVNDSLQNFIIFAFWIGAENLDGGFDLVAHGGCDEGFTVRSLAEFF